MSDYKVIEAFTDLEDSNHVYKPGDVFPRAGVTASEDRIASLASKKNKGKRPFIETAAFPKHSGGGHYELSDGSKVQGKAKAFKAQEKLDGDA